VNVGFRMMRVYWLLGLKERWARFSDLASSVLSTPHPFFYAHGI